jgi:thymidylate synthase
MRLNPVFVEATTLSDSWFQLIWNILDHGRRFTIDKGSYAGSTRLEFDYITIRIKSPVSEDPLDMLPYIPDHYGIPDPVARDYVYGGPDYPRSYIEYLMTETMEPGESYTYGQRLSNYPIQGYHWDFWREGNSEIVDKREVDGLLVVHESPKDEKLLYVRINQIQWIIDTYKKHGHRNNQMVLQVAMPTDCILRDPPCLRHIDTRIQDNKLHFFPYFRSWDLWGGYPANLCAIAELMGYMAGELDVSIGEMICASKGLHLYAYAEDLAKMRTMREDVTVCEKVQETES